MDKVGLLILKLVLNLSLHHITRSHLSPHICQKLFNCFYGQNKSKILQNLFHALLNHHINKKQNPTPRKKPKAVKDSGGLRVGMTAIKDSMVFLKASLSYYPTLNFLTSSSTLFNCSIVLWQDEKPLHPLKVYCNYK